MTTSRSMMPPLESTALDLHGARQALKAKIKRWISSWLPAKRAYRFPPLGESLRSRLGQAGIKLIDIGARRGPMTPLALLAPFASYYACEPDEAELDSVAKKLREVFAWRSVTLIPEAIASTEGEARLFLTRDPGYSSLLRPDQAVVDKFNLANRFEIQATAPIRTMTLDHAAAKYGFQDACFLKLDTQGTELDILRSGAKLTAEALVGVYVEVEFHPFYEGQPLFADVDTFLRDHGFSLFDLHRSLHRRASYQDHLHLYSKRQPVWAHALYFKEPDQFPPGSPQETLNRLCRLLALALAFEHYDFARELVNSERWLPALLGPGIVDMAGEVRQFIEHQSAAMMKRNRRRQAGSPADVAYTDKNNPHQILVTED